MIVVRSFLYFHLMATLLLYQFLKHFRQSCTISRTVEEIKKQYANIKQRGMYILVIKVPGLIIIFTFVFFYLIIIFKPFMQSCLMI